MKLEFIVNDVNDYLSSITTTFPIQQTNAKSFCSLQQEDGKPGCKSSFNVIGQYIVG
jgi:hypothetical protein